MPGISRQRHYRADTPIFFTNRSGQPSSRQLHRGHRPVRAVVSRGLLASGQCFCSPDFLHYCITPPLYYFQLRRFSFTFFFAKGQPPFLSLITPLAICHFRRRYYAPFRYKDLAI